MKKQSKTEIICDRCGASDEGRGQVFAGFSVLRLERLCADPDDGGWSGVAEKILDICPNCAKDADDFIAKGIPHRDQVGRA